MADGPSRRRMLATLGAGTAALAGCTDFISDGGDGNGGGDGEDTGTGASWPAMSAGEQLVDFEDVDELTPHDRELSTFDVAGIDDAVTGSQAVEVEFEAEDENDNAGIGVPFSEPIDLQESGLSMAIRMEGVERLHVEVEAPNTNQRLDTVRRFPDGLDDWFRLDCAYENKPGDDNEPDLSNVQRIHVLAVGSPGQTTRVAVDDLRRVETGSNGKAILVFYGGRDSHYEIGADRLQERDWPGVVPLSNNEIGAGGRMNQSELEELQDRGWDISVRPQTSTVISELPRDSQEELMESEQRRIENLGFEDGARHFFTPDDRMTADTYELARKHFETNFVDGSCPTLFPPTEKHVIPETYGPALYSGVRRHVNLADQYQLLTVFRIPRIVEDPDEDASAVMSVEDYEHLLNHIEARGLDVITPSQLIDEDWTDREGEDEDAERPEGTVFESGQSHALEGSGGGQESIELDEGLVTASFSHDGDAITAEVGDDTLIDTEADSGESVVTVGGGTTQVSVEADGDWEIDVEQPAVEAGDLEDVPTSAEGTGPGWIGPFWSAAGLSVELTHDGSGNFLVDGHDADDGVERIAHATGAFDTSRSYNASGTFWINVEADGEWTLELNE